MNPLITQLKARGLRAFRRGLFVVLCASEPASAQVFDQSLIASTPSEPSSDVEAGSSARELMETGVREYARGNFEAALTAFQKAWELHPHVDIAAALAEVEMELEHYQEAAEHWAYYLQRVPAGGERDRDWAQAQLEAARQHLGQVRVTVEPGGSVHLDNRYVGRSPVELWVAPGTHRLIAWWEDHHSKEKRFTIRAGETRAIVIEVKPVAEVTPLPKGAVQPPEPPPRPVQASSAPQLRTIVLLGGALAAVGGLGTSLGFYLKSGNTEEEFFRLKDQVEREGRVNSLPEHGECAVIPELRPRACEPLREKAEQYDRERDIAYRSLLAGSVLGALTIAGYFLWPEPTSEPEAQAGVSLKPWGGFQHARGVDLQVRF